MSMRRRARECALQLLYMWEFHRGFDPVATEALWLDRGFADAGIREFANKLVNGVVANIDEIDELVRVASLNWRIDRMATVDRNIIRLATYEMKQSPETPLKVILNEAIELSKRYGTEDSSAFVNGVLDKIGSTLRPGSKK
ncbi:MAG: hypothetical protein BWX66_00108 [Deltaproteobacteria bacterium ADurb.Bin058]|nr:MAG: hypothetical protein BWX66_00108 [Deltaproteobacteria bacterium ADurb.Bin058]